MRREIAWLVLRQVDSSYVSDSVEVLSALIIIAQTSLFKSPQPFITLVNYERAYFVEKFLHIRISYFALAKKRRNKKEVCWNSSCSQSVTWS